MPRLYVPDLSPVPDTEFDLPESAARHVQVLRLQPGDTVTLFSGQGGEWQAQVSAMGRKQVAVRLEAHTAVERELDRHVVLAVVMPANDRMDTVVEKATELGATVIQPLMASRSVLRLDGDRATRKVAHWQGVAVAASEQSGRTRVPEIHPVKNLRQWLPTVPTDWARAVLSFAPQTGALPWIQAQRPGQTLCFLNGPEGGLSPEEVQQCLQTGWTPVGLGGRVLRADTAPLMALSLAAGLSST
ncbi:16S rRNA (uracil(1498)-N(3))-methyltransferase [Aquabacterium lacunae]|jgi:16S rRNA (uracil1498-N3)-methyltransferase|uniref:Ribosomal RNA small subunit methyltransferase E n=1 Tax=Aquabacterium lacunae TaxID=2528630 RepID=A0A4Q9H2E7_9BURK|nr:16S rRNA (uracil(1498)-N(3))-methyltransferase [Aquabacterium lacunae]TBO29242.1 16S rRNA (uracil(1498)-N(3))-methyltransferase [Aquabacterium lacunae]